MMASPDQDAEEKDWATTTNFPLKHYRVYRHPDCDIYLNIDRHDWKVLQIRKAVQIREKLANG